MRGGGSKGVPTGQSTRLYLTPSGLDGRFRLVEAGINGLDPASAESTSTVRSFGRRAPDGIALSQSVVLSVTPLEFLDGTEPEPRRLPVLGEDMLVRRDSYGRRTVGWQEADGQTVALTAFGLSDNELIAAAESARSGPAATTPVALPAGFVPGFTGQEPTGPIPGTFQRWEAANGDRVEVGLSEMPGATLQGIASDLPGGHAVSVRRTKAIFSDRDGAVLSWIEAPNVRVMISSTTLGERDLKDIATRLRAIDESSWQQLPAEPRSPAVLGPPTAVGAQPADDASGNSFLVVRPVLRRTQPPCGPAPAGRPSMMVAQAQAGHEVACYEVGSPVLTAADVAGATARKDRVTGRWRVDFTLTAPGAARFQAALVGPGHSLAIIVDGRLVSAPVLETPSPPVVWTVTGLDDQGARSLADRLGA